MSEIKRLINCIVPVTACNLECSYCYVPTMNEEKNKLPDFKYSPEHIRKALSQERLGGKCLFNICGNGETLIPKEIPEIILLLLEEGHYIELVTNGTLTGRINQIIDSGIPALSHLEFKFSFHYLELIQKNLLETYIQNVHRVKEAGCSFTIELVSGDETIPYIDEIRDVCLKNFGALCHITIARDDRNNADFLTSMQMEEYRKVWEIFDSKMFDFKLSTYNQKRKEYCYAGDWMLILNIATGEARQCYSSYYRHNIFKNIDEPIHFVPIGKHCRFAHCFNSHAMMTLGIIPEIDTVSYAEIRNRVCADGSEWLTPEFRDFVSGKFKNNNKQYTNGEKIRNDVKMFTNFGSQLIKRLASGLK